MLMRKHWNRDIGYLAKRRIYTCLRCHDKFAVETMKPVLYKERFCEFCEIKQKGDQGNAANKETTATRTASTREGRLSNH